MRKVLVCGWLSSRNVGDEQYKVSFPTLFPGCEFKFCQDVNKDLLSWADDVVLGGGNILDKKTLEKFNSACHGFEGMVHTFSTGCSDRSLTPAHFSRFNGHKWVRDNSTCDFLSSLGVGCSLVPDAAWALRPDRSKGMGLWKDLFKGKDLYQKKVVVVLNSHLTSVLDQLARDEVRWQNFSNDLCHVIDHTSASFAFLPFGRSMRWDDRAPHAWVAHRCKWHKKNAVVWGDNWSVRDCIDFISAADAVVSQRLHATIFAAVCGVPFVDVTHHDKNKNFLESVGLSRMGISYWDFSRNGFQGLLGECLAGDGSIKSVLEGVARENAEHVLGYAASIKF